MFQRTEVCSALLPPRPAFPPASRAGRGLDVYESVSAGAAASRRRFRPLVLRIKASLAISRAKAENASEWITRSSQESRTRL